MRQGLGRLLRLALAAALPAAGAGCVPNAAWLPDSSGFVYPAGPKLDQLRLYDVKKQAATVLVEGGIQPCRPAVSPDGKRIAAVVAKNRLAVFDRDGKELQRSRELTSRDGGPEDLFWVPGQDRILAAWWLADRAAVYDLRADDLLEMDAHVTVFGSTPIRPDGKGFLATRRKDHAFVFVDWDGKQTPIEDKPRDAFDAGRGGDPTDYNLRDLIDSPLLESSRWDGATAVASWDDCRIRIDAEKLSATRETIQPRRTAAGEIIQNEATLLNGAVIRVVETEPRHSREPAALPGKYRLEVLKPKAKDPETAADGVFVQNILPSPDQTMAIVVTWRARKDGGEPPQAKLYLIDAKGDVAAALDLSR